jgi:hypothetical protein
MKLNRAMNLHITDLTSNLLYEDSACIRQVRFIYISYILTYSSPSRSLKKATLLFNPLYTCPAFLSSTEDAGPAKAAEPGNSLVPDASGRSSGFNNGFGGLCESAFLNGLICARAEGAWSLFASPAGTLGSLHVL